MRKKFVVLTALSLCMVLGIAGCKLTSNHVEDHDVQEVEVSDEANNEDTSLNGNAGSGQSVSHGTSSNSSVSEGENSGSSVGFSHSSGDGESKSSTYSNTQGENDETDNSFGLSTKEESSVSEDVIGEDAALEIALKKAGLTKEEVSEISVEADADVGTDKYEVEFKANGKEYTYDIDMHNGTVYESETEAEDE